MMTKHKFKNAVMISSVKDALIVKAKIMICIQVKFRPLFVRIVFKKNHSALILKKEIM